MSDFIELDESDIQTIDVHTEPLELYKLLKIANLVGGGGEAKMLIADGYVGVNGELCQQKRKKIYQDDLVEFNGEFLQIRLLDKLEQTAEPVALLQTDDNHASKTGKHRAKQNKTRSADKGSKAKSSEKSKSKQSTSGRRSISF
ncbi:RNA-binding S4 domain-containing protein [Thalassotalea mangrovi]|uniref:RNA-binding S4 domain-containing protein n=1 Tax=Thalassotalea mangrovi TaxID=2572245 RepID=UPI00145EB70B|nr:RNA-binding S4 domain-containing protein [Thalassotalea mangrovi]